MVFGTWSRSCTTLFIPSVLLCAGKRKHCFGVVRKEKNLKIRPCVSNGTKVLSDVRHGRSCYRNTDSLYVDLTAVGVLQTYLNAFTRHGGMNRPPQEEDKCHRQRHETDRNGTTTTSEINSSFFTRRDKSAPEHERSRSRTQRCKDRT